MIPDSPISNMHASPALRARLVGLALLTLVAFASALPVLQHDGWPTNHEGMAFFERAETFRQAFQKGTWLPTWTPFANGGYGSAYPLFYHRLFSTLAALLALLTRSVIPAVKLLLVLLLVLGGAGMRRLLRVTAATEPLAVVGGALFILAPYTLTDWLVRGAMAEFTALMLLPWLFAELALFRQGRRAWVRLALLMLLLFHAHSMICYCFLLIVSVFFLILVFGSTRAILLQGIWNEWRSILVAAGILIVGVLPFVVVISRLMPYFRPELMVSYPWRIQDHYWPFSRYFLDTAFTWGEPSGTVSLEISRFVCLAALILHALPGPQPRRAVFQFPLYSFLLGLAGVCLLLQLPAFGFIFHLLPRADFLQFPWRLLSFLTISSIFVLIAGARRALESGSTQRVVGILSLVLVVLFSAVRANTATHIEQGTLTPAAIEADLLELKGQLGAGEYLLKGVEPEQLLQQPHFVQAQNCHARLRNEDKPSQFGEYFISATAEAPCRLSFRQFQTPLLDVSMENATLLSTEPSKAFLIEVQPGHSSIHLRPRSFGQLLWWALASSQHSKPGEDHSG